MFQDLKRDPGQGPPTREAWNAFLERAETLVVSTGPGLLMRQSRSGTTIRLGRKPISRPSGPAYDSVILPKRFIKETEGEGESAEVTWKVEFTPAKLYEHSMNDAGWEHDIKIADGLLTDTDPVKFLPIEEGTNDVWLKFNILDICEVELNTAEIVIGEPPAEVPFQPKRPKVIGMTSGDSPAPIYGSKGETGNYRQKLGTITLEEGKDPVWQSVSPHAIVWIGQTEWEDSDPGAGQSLYYKQEEGKDFFKVAKNADTEVEEGNVGVLNDEETPYSKHLVLARICQKESLPEIHVTSEGENAARKIIIKGNNFDADVSGAVKGLSIRDGLVTAVAEIPPEEGGWWGTIVIHHEDIDPSSNSMWLKLTIQAGKIVSIGVSYSGDMDYTDIPGTEEALGAAVFNSFNTNTIP